MTEGQSGLVPSETWQWWEARRLRYNLALAAAGWLAYGLNAALFYAFDHPIWKNLQGGISMTLFLGALFLVLMGLANICYLAGAITESIVQPADRDGFRRHAYTLGFWGSLAVPFLFPLANLALLIAKSG